MKKKEINLTYLVYPSVDKLDEVSKKLMQKAEETLTNAYAVYSDFYVGAAIYLEDGQIILGNNQENIAFPSSMCAERVALYYCKANFPKNKVKKIAIAARSSKITLKNPITPCGACRQVMTEYERIQDDKIEIILKAEQGDVLVFNSVADLLPLAFQTMALNLI